jgi:hypothetical protein
MKSQTSRRKFIRNLGGTAMLLSAAPLYGFAERQKMEEHIIAYDKNFTSNDKIRIAGIGMGIMGNQDIDTALKVPGDAVYCEKPMVHKLSEGLDVIATRDKTKSY